jgi:acetyl esterase/lipase
MGSGDGPSECEIPKPVNNVAPGEMIVADIESALEWVKTNGGALGAQPGVRVSLVGQSAGAHLAGWLASHHGGDINKAPVLYTPADIKDYVQELGSKYSWDQEGRGLSNSSLVFRI